jgi:hypothetical protein
MRVSIVELISERYYEPSGRRKDRGRIERRKDR